MINGYCITATCAKCGKPNHHWFYDSTVEFAKLSRDCVRTQRGLWRWAIPWFYPLCASFHFKRCLWLKLFLKFSYFTTVAWWIVAFQTRTKRLGGWWTSCPGEISCPNLYSLPTSRRISLQLVWEALETFSKASTKVALLRWKYCTEFLIMKSVN